MVEAKMKIEESLRREKRAKHLEQIMKPLLNTPGTKSNRNAPEIWDGARDEERTTASGQEDPSTPRSRTQHCLEIDQTPGKLRMQSMTKMIGEKCQTQTGSSTRPQPDWPEQTLPEMVNQPRMKSRQAPMISFTIKQSLEEQRTFIN